MINVRSKKFTIGFFCGLSLLVVANIYSYYRMDDQPIMSHGFVNCGVPFKIYEYGGYWTHSVFHWGGLVADVAVAICLSFMLGGAFEKLFVGRSGFAYKITKQPHFVGSSYPCL
jgi:hypothetical protein